MSASYGRLKTASGETYPARFLALADGFEVTWTQRGQFRAVRFQGADKTTAVLMATAAANLIAGEIV